jgi:hypothetical protein
VALSSVALAAQKLALLATELLLFELLPQPTSKVTSATGTTTKLENLRIEAVLCDVTAVGRALEPFSAKRAPTFSRTGALQLALMWMFDP